MAYLNIGQKAPVFSGINQNDEIITLEQFKGKKVIVFFYPKDNTPGCTAEACNLRDNYNDWVKKGYEVIGISPDSVSSHQKFVNKFSLPYHLIADTEKEILKTYGVWGEKKNYGKVYDGVLRTTYVINEEGIVSHIFTKVDTKEHTSQLLKELNG